MSHKSDIWMPLYIGDYLADTADLNAERSGCYLHWLMHYWRKGPLPDDVDALVRIGKLDSPDAPSITQALLRKFFFKNGDGTWHQKRTDAERERWNAKHNKNKEKAEKAAAARWENHAPSNAPSNASGILQAMLEQCPSSSQINTLSEAKASSPLRDAEAGLKHGSPEREIYNAYPRKKEPDAAIKAITQAVQRVRQGKGISAIPDLRDAQKYLYRRVVAYARSDEGSGDKKFIPYPQKWFNKSRYLEDDAEWQVNENHSKQPKLKIPTGPGGE